LRWGLGAFSMLRPTLELSFRGTLRSVA